MLRPVVSKGSRAMVGAAFPDLDAAARDALIDEGVQAGVFRTIDPQLFYFTVTGAVDRFFSARLVL